MDTQVNACPTCGQPLPAELAPPPPPTPYMAVDEIATRVRRSAKYVRDAMRRGELVAQQRAAHGPWRAHVQDVDAWARGERQHRGRKGGKR